MANTCFPLQSWRWDRNRNNVNDWVQVCTAYEMRTSVGVPTPFGGCSRVTRTYHLRTKYVGPVRLSLLLNFQFGRYPVYDSPRGPSLTFVRSDQHWGCEKKERVLGPSNGTAKRERIEGMAGESSRPASASGDGARCDWFSQPAYWSADAGLRQVRRRRRSEGVARER